MSQCLLTRSHPHGKREATRGWGLGVRALFGCCDGGLLQAVTPEKSGLFVCCPSTSFSPNSVFVQHHWEALGERGVLGLSLLSSCSASLGSRDKQRNS